MYNFGCKQMSVKSFQTPSFNGLEMHSSTNSRNIQKWKEYGNRCKSEKVLTYCQKFNKYRWHYELPITYPKGEWAELKAGSGCRVVLATAPGCRLSDDFEDSEDEDDSESESEILYI